MPDSNFCCVCGEHCGFFRWGYKCSVCGKTVCADCSTTYVWGYDRVCDKCYDKIDKSLPSFKVAVSDHIGGHRITKSFGDVENWTLYRDRQCAIDDLKYRAIVLGANAIVSLTIYTGTDEEEGPNGGIHYYSVFKGSAKAVRVEKYNNKTDSKKGLIGSEIEKLVSQLKNGYLSEEEFKEAKRILLKKNKSN